MRTAKPIRTVLHEKPELYGIIDWDLTPDEAVARYMEWGNNWNRGLNHAKACSEEAAYFKIDAREDPPKLLLVKHSHHDYEIIDEVEAPVHLIRQAVGEAACEEGTCGINEVLRAWLHYEADRRFPRYWRCPNSSCDAEWYSWSYFDWTCPRCSQERCAESWHPEDFAEAMKILKE